MFLEMLRRTRSYYIVIQLHYNHVDLNVEKFAFTEFRQEGAFPAPEKIMLTEFTRFSDPEFSSEIETEKWKTWGDDWSYLERAAKAQRLRDCDANETDFDR